MDVRAEIITVGDELLTGFTVNTNAAVLGQKLLEVGVGPCWVTVVSDNEEEISSAVRRSVERADVVIVTGGLGPTADDRTREGVAAGAGRKLELRSDLLGRMRERWRARGPEMPESNTRQAYIPQGAAAIENRVGTAPGFRMTCAGVDVFVIPGPPAEMRGMLEDAILPYLESRFPDRIRKYRTLHTIGWPESGIAQVLSERLPGSLQADEQWSLAYLPHAGSVDLRIGASGSPDQVNRTLRGVARRIRRILGPVVYGTDGQTLESVVGSLLRTKGLSVAVAESCTGGLISHLLTNVPGSSGYFDRAVVAYSNRTKTSVLGVNPGTLRAHGAVSEEVAVEMAWGVRRLAGTRIGLSATGIAGPGGGTKAKPVGLVYVGLSVGRRACGFRFRFPGGRELVKRRSARAALNVLRLYLLGGTLDGLEP
ncbi:MAG: competence/damage-inducible protein A [Candidatus Eisenbacteria sp.]|nr:competence/damage-inducible protein A [Candidatus Eisenbacteria bacterium]